MPTFVVGDVHGHVEPLVAVLRDAELLDGRAGWAGRDARLWFIGDLVDRGPDGIAVIELLMRLQCQHGDVRCLLGNHEAGLVGASRFPDVDRGFPGVTFRLAWEANGGVQTDLARLTPEHVHWIERLPAIAREGDWLLVHSDTDRYLEYGGDVDSIRSTVASIVGGSDTVAFARLLDDLADRGAFLDPHRLRRLLQATGCERLAHGHTPIWYASGRDPTAVETPHQYASGRVLNVDHGLYSGGRGFVVQIA
jgi:hypothetical protein